MDTSLNLAVRELTDADQVYVQRIVDLINIEVEEGNVLSKTENEIRHDIIWGHSVGAFAGEILCGYHAFQVWGGLIELRSLVVDPEYRGRRLGTRLVQEIIKIATKKYPKFPIFAIVRPTSKKIYESLGIIYLEKAKIGDQFTEGCKACRDYPMFPRCSCVVLLVRNGQTDLLYQN